MESKGIGMRTIKTEIEVDPSLYKEDFMDVIRTAIDNSALSKQVIAAELDLTPSILSRILSYDDPTSLPVTKLPKLIEILDDTTIVSWFNCNFGIDKARIKAEYIGQLARLEKAKEEFELALEKFEEK